jgi:hypothetical protein
MPLYETLVSSHGTTSGTNPATLSLRKPRGKKLYQTLARCPRYFSAVCLLSGTRTRRLENCPPSPAVNEL